MPTLGDKKKPQLFKYVARPANVGNSEVAKARPIYIDGLPEGGGDGGGGGPITTDDVTLQDVLEGQLDGLILSEYLTELSTGMLSLDNRIAALELPGEG